MKLFLILIVLALTSSCASRKIVRMDTCRNQVGNLADCEIVE